MAKAFAWECAAALGQADGIIDEDVETSNWFGCQAKSLVLPVWWFWDGQPGGRWWIHRSWVKWRWLGVGKGVEPMWWWVTRLCCLVGEVNGGFGGGTKIWR